MKLSTQKRLAADVMKVGTSRVWMDPGFEDEVSLAITRDDIRRLVEEGAIQKKRTTGVSRGRARYILQQKRKGQRKGPGTKKGKATSKMSGKDRWMMKIRPMRKELRILRDTGKITPKIYRELYLKAKGNAFRNTAHLRTYITERRLSK
ncbi:50S ribosomal protein L19e [Candidatus Thorarchaeota archaeon]|nr:50S ribosomal protein L19e [Candidatus Thorarchaeota archaeon]TFG94953.1 MAG: 50S ribosomal protein L19e [Candidatus Thorarchaeota archaeon]